MQSDLLLSTSLYGQSFFQEIREGSLSSARVIVPYLIEWLKPNSVLDVGCAEGAWLSIFEEHGINDCFGIDGDYVDRTRLLIDPDKFLIADLRNEVSLARKFDLAICLEVAEHLPAESANRLVSTLVSHAPCIVFSASILFQDGTGHINEQWPAYWANLFRSYGYEPIDCIRSRVWNDSRVRWWFAQNTIVYYDTKLASLGELVIKMKEHLNNGDPLPLVHPELLLHKEQRLKKLIDEEQRLKCVLKNIKSLRWLIRQMAKTILHSNRQND